MDFVVTDFYDVDSPHDPITCPFLIWRPNFFVIFFNEKYWLTLMWTEFSDLIEHAEEHVIEKPEEVRVYPRWHRTTS